jgi:hypothetical protein
MDVVGEFMKPVFLHQGCLKKSTILGHAEQFANNIRPLFLSFLQRPQKSGRLTGSPRPLGRGPLGGW